jgi:squalene cyclase
MAIYSHVTGRNTSIILLLAVHSVQIMGRTIPSYRLASEREKRKWKIFRQELDKSERKMFDEMMSYSRLHKTSGVMACKPVLIQPILMSIIFEH